MIESYDEEILETYTDLLNDISNTGQFPADLLKSTIVTPQ